MIIEQFKYSKHVLLIQLGNMSKYAAFCNKCLKLIKSRPPLTSKYFVSNY